MQVPLDAILYVNLLNDRVITQIECMLAVLYHLQCYEPLHG